MRSPVNPLAWQDDALCAETDLEAFFPDKGGSSNDAKRICSSCGVREKCLQFALAMDENPAGIWGGTSVRERRAMREKPTPAPKREAKGLRREWTDEEDAILFEMAELANTIIGRRIKRNVSSIRKRRQTLGIPPSTDPGGRPVAA